MANENYVSGLNMDALMVPTQAATIYTAQENSLFLSGNLIPMVNVPAGSASAQVALMGTTDADYLTAETNADIESELPSDTKTSIALGLIASRAVVRDLGGVNTSDIGRILGNAVASKVDTLCATELGDLTGQEITSGDLDLEEIYKAVGTIRAAGEGGQLFGVVGASSYAALMNSIGSAAVAGGDFQTQALRSGFLANIAGVQCFVSSYLNDTNTGVTGSKMAIFSQDAVRGAIQGSLKVEMARRPAAVGVDVVASVGFGVSEIDASRGVLIKDAA